MLFSSKYISALFATLLLGSFSGTDFQTSNDDVSTQSAAVFDPVYTVNLHPEDKQAISPLLMGFNLVYAHETDAIWSGGKVTGFMNDVNASIFRYPGGTVTTFYHWNELTGEGWKDSWDPVNPVTPKPGSAFMNVDEFMNVIRNTNSIPLVGINMSSGKRWNRLQDGIDEALALMRYLKNNNFTVSYYYLDNEPYQDDSNGGSKTVTEYAELVNLYATEMRKLDPDIKIIVNWRQAFKNRRSEYQTLFNIAGKNIDVVDVHWYWNWSNSSMAEWLLKTPMVLWTGDTFLQEIAYFRQMLKDFGYPDTKLACLEWNTGAVTISQFTPQQIALAHSEMQMIFILGGLDMATFWPLQWPSSDVTLRSFYNRYTSTPQPNYNTFKFLGKLQGSKLLRSEVTQSQPHILIVAAHDDENDILRICYLNKNSVNIRANILSEIFGNMVLEEAVSYTLTGDGSSSELIPIQLQEHNSSGISFIAPDISLNMLTFKRIGSSNLDADSKRMQNISVYPNPASGFISLDLPGNEKGARVEVATSTGNSLLTKNLQAGQVKSQLDISQLKSGVYFVILEIENVKSVKKLVIP